MTATVVEVCWCGGKKSGEKKHNRKGEPGCEQSRADRREYDKKRPKRKYPPKPGAWRTGTPIEIPEVDPL